MAYTGTGTQADPAIPNTITELYDIFNDARSSNVNGNTSGPYYVKLTKNIDCADDENYIGYKGKMHMGAGQNNRVCLMYSDNNNYIRGLTVKDAYFIENTGETTSSRSFIQNISFIDCFFKPPSDYSSNSSMVFSIGNNGGGFIDCTFSISMFPFEYNNKTRFVNISNQNMTSNGCSYYFKYNGNFPLTSKNGVGTDNLVRFNYALASNNNVFIFEGGYIQSSYSANYYLISSNNQKSYNAFLFKNTQIESGSTINVLGSTSSYSYVAFINPSLSSAALAGINNVTSGLTCCMIGTDKWSEVFTLPTQTQNVIYYPTLNQLKSSDYLLSIGFIP